MSYLELNLDPFITLWKEVNNSVIHPLNLLNYVESTYSGGVCFTYHPNIPLFSEISTIKKLTSARINIKINSDIDNLKKVFSLEPDVITIINKNNLYDAVHLPSKMIKKIIKEGEENDIPVIPRVNPKLDNLKQTYKMDCSDVVITTNKLSTIDSQDEFNQLLGLYAKCYRIAHKNNLRISFGGNLNKRLILAIKKLMEPEFFTVGDFVLSQAIIRGIETTLRETVELIEK